MENDLRSERLWETAWKALWSAEASSEAHAVLRASLFALLEDTDACILVSDSSGHPLFFNSNYARVIQETLGIRMAPGVQPHRLLPEPEKKWWEAAHRRVLGGERFVEEAAFTFPDGGIHHFEIHFHPVRIDERTVGFSEVSREITEIKRVETALRESEEHLRSLLENARQFAVYRLRIDPSAPHGFRVVFVSPSIRELTGVADPLSFETWLDRVHPEDRSRLFEAGRFAVETQRFDEVIRFEVPGRTRSRWIHVVSNAVRAPEGPPLYVNGIMIDVSERKRIEDKLAERERQLESKSKTLQEVNVALRVLLRKREEDQAGVEENVMANVNELILPHLEKARSLTSDQKAAVHLDIVRENVREIVSPFGRQLASPLIRLTPSEIQVAHLVKHGHTSKEIAAQLSISPKTVEVHRLRIRKKLGIAGKKANLRTHLMNLAQNTYKKKV